MKKHARKPLHRVSLLLSLALPACQSLPVTVSGPPAAAIPSFATAWNDLLAGRFDIAEGEMGQRLAAEPGDAQTRAAFALLLLYEGRLDQGLQQALRAAAQGPAGFTDAVLTRANDWNSDLDAAALAGRRAVAADPGLPVAHAFLGEALADQHNFDQAQRELTQAANLADGARGDVYSRAEAQRDWANFYADRNDTTDREKALKMAFQLEPLFPPRATELSQFYFDQGQEDQARAVLDQAASDPQASPDLLEQAGDAAILGYDYSRAVSFYQRAVQARPEDAPGIVRLAQARFATDHQVAAAEEALRSALRIDAGDLEALSLLLGLGRATGDSSVATAVGTLSSTDPPPGAAVRAQLPDYATWQTQMRAQAIDLVNGARHRAGLSPVTEQTALDQSTEAHAMYWLFNEADPTTRKLGIHLETPGLFGYVGSSSYVRALHFGLRPAGTLEDITHATDVPHSISDWVDSVFHRFAIMAPEALTAGYSLEQVGALPIQVLDVATGGRANSSAVVLYPSPGQSDVPVAFFGNELPDPTPEATANHLYPVGYPITATFSESASVSVSHSTFTDAQGKALEYWELEPNTGDMGNNWAIVPKAPLTPGATYHVSFAGTLNGQSLHRDWSFTTGSS